MLVGAGACSVNTLYTAWPSLYLFLALIVWWYFNSIRNGLVDEVGAEKLMFEALEKVEKDIKKPLLRNDKKNMALLLAEFDKVNKK